jgi:hypothetical protein
MNHRAHILLLTALALSLVACGPPSGEPEPTFPPATERAEPSDTPEPAVPTDTPEPEETATPTPDPRRDLAAQSYQAMAGVQAVAEMASHMATEIQAGEVTEFNVPFLLLVMDDFVQGVDGLLDTITPVGELQQAWDDAVANHAVTKSVITRWQDGEIVAAQVLAELASVIESMETILAGAETLLSGEYGFAADEITGLRDAALGAVDLPDQAEAATVGDEALTVLDHNWHVSDFDDSLSIVGLVRNDHDVALDMVEATVNLLDAAGDVVGTQTLPAELLVLQRGEVSPFDVGFWDDVPAWESYEISFSGREWDGLFPVYTDFEILSHSAEIGTLFGELNVEGQIQNTGDTEAETVFVSVVLYDAAGKIIGVGEGGLWDRDTLAPGDVAPFSAMVASWAGEWARYEFFFSSYPLRVY